MHSKMHLKRSRKRKNEVSNEVDTSKDDQNVAGSAFLFSFDDEAGITPKQRQKQKQKQKKNEPLEFITIGNNQLALSHAPSNDLLQFWSDDDGITDCVSLIRRDEPKCRNIMEKCAALDVKWHHFPISGAKQFCYSVTKKGFEAATNARNKDMKSLLRTKDIVDILKTNDADDSGKKQEARKVVIHCAAGQHRTGIFTYIIMRQLGYDTDEILRLIGKVRSITSRELAVKRKTNSWFRDKNMRTLIDFCEGYLQFLDKAQYDEKNSNSDEDNDDSGSDIDMEPTQSDE